MQRLNSKVAIITGGNGDIGMATAKVFLNEGAKVLLVGRREKALISATEKLQSKNVSYAVADVTNPEQVKNYVKTAIERYQRLDILVNNAGIEGVVCPLHEYPIEEFEKVIHTNIKGVWLGLKYAIPAMMKSGNGSIIITSSIGGFKGMPLTSAYNASKHAEIGLMRTAAVEYAQHKIRVNCINPAPIEGRMMNALENGLMPGGGKEIQTAIANSIPMKRYGTTDEVANLMLFLASDESSYCTGGVYTVDGGISAQ